VDPDPVIGQDDERLHPDIPKKWAVASQTIGEDFGLLVRKRDRTLVDSSRVQLPFLGIPPDGSSIAFHLDRIYSEASDDDDIEFVGQTRGRRQLQVVEDHIGFVW
jgi:hypothetical protein